MAWTLVSWCCGQDTSGSSPTASLELSLVGRGKTNYRHQNAGHPFFSLQSCGLASDPPSRSRWLKEAVDFPAAEDRGSRLDAFLEGHISWIRGSGPLHPMSGRELAASRLQGGWKGDGWFLCHPFPGLTNSSLGGQDLGPAMVPG